MIVAIAFACFVFGFGVAIASSSEKSKGGIAELLSSLRQVAGGNHKYLDGDTEKSKSHSNNFLTAVPKDGGLLTKEEVESEFEPSSWQGLAYQDFKTSILAKQSGMKTFPCIYATMGYRSGEHRYVFLKSDDPAEPQNIRLIAPALKAYLEMSPSLGSNTSLVIVCAPSEKERSVKDHNDNFWHMLSGLRITDPKPWPKDVPEDTESERWTFCYNGEPVFPVMLTPAHMRRWSRHMSVPIIALQPKWVLDKLLSSPEKREAATGKVRKLLKEYDQIDISPDLTSYGQPGTSESRQLCLLDQNETSQCPYNNLDRRNSRDDFMEEKT